MGTPSPRWVNSGGRKGLGDFPARVMWTLNKCRFSSSFKPLDFVYKTGLLPRVPSCSSPRVFLVFIPSRRHSPSWLQLPAGEVPVPGWRKGEEAMDSPGDALFWEGIPLYIQFFLDLTVKPQLLGKAGLLVFFLCVYGGRERRALKWLLSHQVCPQGQR